eukprot:290202-Rhodomonas_salina.1
MSKGRQIGCYHVCTKGGVGLDRGDGQHKKIRGIAQPERRTTGDLGTWRRVGKTCSPRAARAFSTPQSSGHAYGLNSGRVQTSSASGRAEQQSTQAGSTCRDAVHNRPLQDPPHLLGAANTDVRPGIARHARSWTAQ